jgi:hypothetical protein
MKNEGFVFVFTVLVFFLVNETVAIVDQRTDKASDQLYFVDRFGFQKGGFVEFHFQAQVPQLSFYLPLSHLKIIIFSCAKILNTKEYFGTGCIDYLDFSTIF